MIKSLLEWLTTKARMPHYVWLSIMFILIAIGIKILIAKDLVIEANEKLSLALCTHQQAEAHKKAVEKAAEEAIVELEDMKNTTVHPATREVFSTAQMKIRDIKLPECEQPKFGEALHAAKK